MKKIAIKTDLASPKIVEDFFEKGRAFIQERKDSAQKMISIATKYNKDAAKLAQQMEKAAKDLEKSVKQIGIDVNDFPEIEATLKYAEKVGELQNSYARIAMLINKELS
jgi:hypothetical protein